MILEKARKSLVFKTALLFLVAAIIPYVLASLLFFNSSKKALRGEIVNGMGNKIGIARDSLDAKLFLLRGNSTAWAAMEVMTDTVTDDIDKRIALVLEGLKRDYSLSGDIYVINARRRIVASSKAAFIGKRANGRWLSGVLSGERTELDAHTSDIDGSFVISFCVPIRPSAIGKKITGALVLEYRMDESEVAKLSGDGVFAAILNRRGDLVAVSSKGPFGEVGILRLIKDARGDTVIFPSGYIVAVAESKGLFDFKGFGWKVVMAVEEARAFAPVKRIGRVSVGVGFLGAALILVLVSLVAARTVRPLKELSRTADYMSRTKDLSMKVGASSKDEIGTLADAFNNMVEEVKTHISNLQRANIELLEVLGSAIAKRDSDTSVHNYRVTVIAIRLAEAAGLGRGEIKALIKGSFLHDVGKIGISDNILIKPDRLTSEEFETMKGHVRHGIDIISSYNWLKDASDVVRYHHEKYDGSGYMSGMSGEDIPLNARIFAIADVFDALTSLRPYKKPLCYEDAMRILEESSGSHFDPNLLGVFKGIAETVYGEIVHAGDSDIEDVLKRLINEYFYRG